MGKKSKIILFSVIGVVVVAAIAITLYFVLRNPMSLSESRMIKDLQNDKGLSSLTTVFGVLQTCAIENWESLVIFDLSSVTTSSMVNCSSNKPYKFMFLPSRVLNEKYNLSKRLQIGIFTSSIVLI